MAYTSTFNAFQPDALMPDCKEWLFLMSALHPIHTQLMRPYTIPFRSEYAAAVDIFQSNR